MPYIQKATANYFGFAPVVGGHGMVQINPYLVSSSEGTAINAGDVVVLTTLVTAKHAGTGSFTGRMLGIAANSLVANGGSTAATIISNTSQLLHVYDNQSQLFVGCVTTSFLLGSTAVSKNIAVLATGAVGSSGPNGSLLRSVMALSGNTASSAGAFQLIGLHPVEQGDFSTDAGGSGVAASARKWIVKPIQHVWAQSSAAAQIITS